MALTLPQITDAAMAILRDYGLADLTMRRLAKDLQVQPGALYWHVKNKQDLLTVLAGLIMENVTETPSLRALAISIRESMLSVRDGAEVVALALALAPEGLPLSGQLRQHLTRTALPPQQQEWAVQALIHYILGTVTQEQTRAGLHRAGILEDAGETGPGFEYGLDLLLSGLPQ